MQSNGPLEVIKLRSSRDVETCTRMYLDLNDESFVATDYISSYKNLFEWVRGNQFVRMVIRDGRILAWIYARPVQLAHMKEPMFQQIYYCSKQTGVLAVRLLVLLHEELIEEAKRRGITKVASPGSPLDDQNTMARILEKNGWKRRGYLAVLDLPTKAVRVDAAVGQNGTK